VNGMWEKLQAMGVLGTDMTFEEVRDSLVNIANGIALIV
jgi:hypothetical protein